jgi:transcriptional regulator with XRE-family HTH domain
MSTVGQNIKKLRRKKGWSQSVVAEKLNISIPAFSKIETGITDINITRLAQVAEVFGVPVESIILKPGESFDQENITSISELTEKLKAREAEILSLQSKLIKLYEMVRP